MVLKRRNTAARPAEFVPPQADIRDGHAVASHWLQTVGIPPFEAGCRHFQKRVMRLWNSWLPGSLRKLSDGVRSDAQDFE